jgi:hypothetical protein
MKGRNIYFQDTQQKDILEKILIFTPFNSHIKTTLANVHLTASNYILIHNMISACINTPTLKSYTVYPRLKLHYCGILYILQIACTAPCSVAVDLIKE